MEPFELEIIGELNTRPTGQYRLQLGRYGLVWGTLFNGLNLDFPEEVILKDSSVIDDDYTLMDGTAGPGSGAWAGNGRLHLPDLRGHFDDEATIMLRIKRVDTTDSGLWDLNTATDQDHWDYGNSGYVGAFTTTRYGFSISNHTNWDWVIVRTKPGAGNWECIQDTTSRYTATGQSTISLPASPMLGTSRSSAAGWTANAYHDVAYLFNRYLEDDEIATIRDNRYMLVTPTDEAYVFPAASLPLPSYYVAADTATPPSYEVAMEVEYT